MADPIKELITQGASQFGMMNTQLAQGMATALTQGVSQLNMMASSMTAAAPDLGSLTPAGMPGMPSMPGAYAARPAPVRSATTAPIRAAPRAGTPRVIR